MTLIVCLDDQLGMMFNHRRQSRDGILIDDLIETVGNARLLAAPYSASLFEGKPCAPVWTEDPCGVMQPGDFCFVESPKLIPSTVQFSSVIVYRWNQCYPADEFFRTDLRVLNLISRTYFKGSSHETITKEVWKR